MAAAPLATEDRDHDAARPGAADPAALAGRVCGFIRRARNAPAICAHFRAHFGGAGTADEWWSTIFQSLPSFT
jgi:hypothetical protein